MKKLKQKPADAGFRMPAEWEPHEATWLAWPHNVTDWPGKMGAVQWAYAEMVRKLTLREKVRILIRYAVHEKRVRGMLEQAGVNLDQVEFLRVSTDRAWMRDTGPLFVKGAAGKGDSRAIIDFHFNAWARYPDWNRDRQIAGRAARHLGVPLHDAQWEGKDFVLEGGSIDVNGAGALLTTEQCLLDHEVQARNPHLTKSDVEAALRGFLGVEQVIWLGSGITGDDTHGHVDDLCRFVNATTVVICSESNSRDVNAAALAENMDRLRSVTLKDGSRLEVMPLPMPGPLLFAGERLPASYANFYIANGLVLVPTFNDPNDRVALGILADLFPGREVVGIHAVDLVLGHGSVHCLSQQEPIA